MQQTTNSADWFTQALEWISLCLEAGGVLVITIGVVAASVRVLAEMRGLSVSQEAYRQYRARLARGILVGLEFLVAADIIGTVAIEPNLENLAVLAGIVAIRTVLSFALEVEVEGRWPWQRARDAGNPS